MARRTEKKQGESIGTTSSDVVRFQAGGPYRVDYDTDANGIPFKGRPLSLIRLEVEKGDTQARVVVVGFPSTVVLEDQFERDAGSCAQRPTASPSKDLECHFPFPTSPGECGWSPPKPVTPKPFVQVDVRTKRLSS